MMLNILITNIYLNDKLLNCIISNRILKSPTKWNSQRSLSLHPNSLAFIALNFFVHGFFILISCLKGKKKRKYF